jgi:hypothetical protein
MEAGEGRLGAYRAVQKDAAKALVLAVSIIWGSPIAACVSARGSAEIGTGVTATLFNEINKVEGSPECR